MIPSTGAEFSKFVFSVWTNFRLTLLPGISLLQEFCVRRSKMCFTSPISSYANQAVLFLSDNKKAKKKGKHFLTLIPFTPLLVFFLSPANFLDLNPQVFTLCYEIANFNYRANSICFAHRFESQLVSSTPRPVLPECINCLSRSF